MEVRLQSGKLIIVETGRLDEVWKLRGFLTEEEMKEVEEAAKSRQYKEQEMKPLVKK